jgi:hypothetical protein
MDVSAVIERLLRSDEPSVRWKARAGVPGEDADSADIAALREEVRRSERVRKLLSRRDAAGRTEPVRSVYAKWQGAHWVLAALADIGYPAGDESLGPVRDQVQGCWLDEQYFLEFEPEGKAAAYGKRGVPVMRGRRRMHASQPGNALFAIVTLGLEDERTPQLVERLLHWQWPDGGWNCDKDPAADTSSFMETVTPIRGLAAYAKRYPDAAVTEAVRRAAEIFLERRLFRRRSGGRVIHSEFLKLHYPLYWHYDILHGLKAMAEAGMIGDTRCADALDELERKRLPDGGWPAEAKYYTASDEIKLGNDSVDWGGTSKLRMNEWVTADALSVLRAAGRVTV